MARVLLIAPTCDGEDVGEAWVAYQWAAHLAPRHDLTVLTYYKRGRTPTSRQVPGARVIEWPEPALLGRAERFNSLLKPGYVPFYVRARRWIRRALADGERFDVAHQPVPVAMRYPSPVVGMGIPFVVGPVGGSLADPPGFTGVADTAPWYTRLRGIDRFRLRHDPLLRRTYESANCVLAIADYVRDSLRGLRVARLEIMSETALSALPDPVDRSAHRGPVRLLYVGRLVRTKGAREALRAMALLREVDVVLDVVGDGPDRATCEALADDLGLRDRVTFHGTRTRPEVAEHYRNADVFVFPSYREPGGNVVFEAMGYALPLVVARRGGPASATDDDCAVRVPVTTPEALADGVAQGVRRLATDPVLRSAMGAAGRERVRRIGLWDGKVEAVERVYDSIRATASGR